jgi:alcohol dehydrogenase class IV
MPYFLSPKVIFGKGALNRLGPEIEGKGSRAVLITDRNMVRFSGRVVEPLEKAGYEVRVWDGARPDPTLDLALAGSKILLEFEPHWVIGLGGGSSIDTAKAAWVFYERPDLASEGPVKPIIPKIKLGLRQKARFLSIPTTSGTGADVTWVAVLTDPAKNRKLIFAHNDIVPDISILDPELTLGMPGELTAGTGMDVLCHAVDGYTSRQRTDFSDGLCLQAVKMTFEWLPRAFENGDDLTARERMQNAATIGGLGFGNSNTGLSHALGHAAGALLHIPHGRVCGSALPYSLHFITSHPPLENAPDPVERLGAVARFIGLDSTAPQKGVQALIRKVRELQRKVQEPLSLQEAGISSGQMEEHMDLLTELAGRDPNMYTTPCRCTKDDIRLLFEDMWTGWEGSRSP